MDIAADCALVGHRNYLSGLGVVSKAGRIRHANELVFDDRLVDLQRLRHHAPEGDRVRPVGDCEELPIDEPVGTRWIGWIRQRHRERVPANVLDLHDYCLLLLRINRHRPRSNRELLRRGTVACGVSKLCGAAFGARHCGPPPSAPRPKAGRTRNLWSHSRKAVVY